MTTTALAWFATHPVTFWLTVLLAGDSVMGIGTVVVRAVRLRARARRGPSRA